MSSYIPPDKQTVDVMCASADKVLKKYNIFDTPINVYEILYHLDVPVDFREFRSTKLEGVYLRNVTGPGIGINSQHGWVKKRFTAAHELKHHLHDNPLIGNQFCFSNEKSIIEQRANRFAAELLVPPPLLNVIYKELDRLELVTVNILAKTFHVSYDTIVYRLNTLGYINSTQQKQLLSDDGRQEDKNEFLRHKDTKRASQLKTPAILLIWKLIDVNVCPECRNALIKPDWIACPFCCAILQV